ncbi:MAG TPA: dockerin type I domain-containing protein, partial [Candidatus Binatia bacterium]
GDANPCTTDACDEQSAACEHDNNSLPCDDGLFCTVGDTCSGGACSGGPARDCSDNNPCTTDSCSEGSHSCENQNNIDPCDDGDPCTRDDACHDGSCSGTAIPHCNQTTTTTQACPVCGDVDGDCQILASDALAVLKAAVGSQTCELSICDFNGDGKITANDALATLKAAVGTGPEPKCPT